MSERTDIPNNALIGSVGLRVLELNQVAATIALCVSHAQSESEMVKPMAMAEVFEVGFDGSKPDSPVAVLRAKLANASGQRAPAELRMRIGTPFLWTPAAQPCYAAIISVEQGERVEQVEVQFGFDATGRIVITEELKKTCYSSPVPNSKLPSLFVVSDSTASSNGKNQRGWGDELGKYFVPGKINVLNRAKPGRSTRSFRNEGLWNRVLAEMKAGDFVLFQFGNNDADKLDEGRCRGVLPGIGEETTEVVMPGGTKETVHTYGWYLCQLIAETKAKGATPILLSLTAKNIWENGFMKRNQSEYGCWVAQVAQAVGVDFIDLTQLIADHYDALGQEKVQPLFCSVTDNVHTSPAGAELNAKCIVVGIKKINQNTLVDFIL